MIFSVILIAFSLWMLGNTLLSFFLLPRLAVPTSTKYASGKDMPLVSLLVPARNEENVIEACVRSLLEQTYSRREIIVMDDGSTDRTWVILQRLKQEHPQGHLLSLHQGTPLPENWVGKCWACHQLSGHAKGEWLLFTDADTVHEPGATASVLSFAQEEGTGLLTVLPRQEAETWAEKVVLPVIFWMVTALAPLLLLRLLQRHPVLSQWIPEPLLTRLGAANGQFLFFSRAAYAAIGGHANQRVKNHMVEDVALGGEILRTRKHTLLLADGTEIVRCRMYRGFGEVWSGFSKNLWPLFEGNRLQFVLMMLFFAGIFAGPLLLLALTYPCVNPALVAFILVQAGLFALIRQRFRIPTWNMFLFPLAGLLIPAIGLNSFRLGRLGRLPWKGRLYSGPSTKS